MTPGDELDRDVWVRRAWTATLVGCLFFVSTFGMWKCQEYLDRVNPLPTTTTTSVP